MNRQGGRGQTTLDFAIGIGVFLLVVAFTLAFVPGLVDPYSGGLEEETVASNRVADSLSQGLLADPDEPEPYLLDRACTIAFFESVSDPSVYGGGCNFEDSPLTERLGLEGRNGPPLNVRVGLVRDLEGTEIDSADDDQAEVLCLDANDDRIIEGDDPTDSSNQCHTTGGDDDVYFQVGGTPPEDRGSVVIARRVVAIEGGLNDGSSDATLVVEMW